MALALAHDADQSVQTGSLSDESKGLTYGELIRDYEPLPDTKLRPFGKPNYACVNKIYFQNRSTQHEPGSLEAIVQELGKNWEVESHHQLPPSSPASSEVSEPSDMAAERRNSMNGLPFAWPLPKDDTHKTGSVPNSTNVVPNLLSVQDLDRAWRALHPSMEWLSTETLHDDACGVHPSHPMWIGETRIMLRNIPCRCKQDELEKFISAETAAAGVSPNKCFVIMPPGSNGRNRGYAFIHTISAEIAMELVRALWQKHVPTRSSVRPLKLQPAFAKAEVIQFSLLAGNTVSL
jgi:hypothetical protein